MLPQLRRARSIASLKVAAAAMTGFLELGGGACSSSPAEPAPLASDGWRGYGAANGYGGEGASPAGAGGAGGVAGGGAGAGGAAGASGHFSFFVTSIDAMRRLSGSLNGFGGDLRFGETGEGAGLRGADKICATIAESSMPGSGAKGWRAFLSAPTGADDGGPVHARDRIGSGPWYDRLGRLVASGLPALFAFRPLDADPAILNDLPNEHGIPNHTDGRPGCVGNACPDNHDTLTGSAADGTLYPSDNNPTCSGWTTSEPTAGRPRVGHSWPRTAVEPGSVEVNPDGSVGTYGHWISSLDEAGCAAGINLAETGPPVLSDPTVGSGGGYGGIYCFALVP